MRRWDSERELSLRRRRTHTTKYNRVVHKFRHRSTRLCVRKQVYQIQWNNAMQRPLRRLRSFKVTDFGTNRKLICVSWSYPPWLLLCLRSALTPSLSDTLIVPATYLLTYLLTWTYVNAKILAMLPPTTGGGGISFFGRSLRSSVRGLSGHPLSVR